MWSFIAGFLIALFSVFIWKTRQTKRFDLSEELLNLEPAKSHWGNLGYWKNTTNYATACTQLSQLVADKADLNSDAEIMDVGFGCGDQLLLWHQEYQVNSISALNTSQQQVGLAQLQLRQAKIPAFIHHLNHQALANQTDRQFSHILSVDAAYFFQQRNEWFKQAHRVLKPEGKLVVTDLIMPDQPSDQLQSFFMKSALWLCGIPLDNVITLEQYRQQLNQANFRQVDTTDISAEVMDGFAEWLPNYQAQFNGLQHFPIWQKYRGTANILRWLRKHDLLRCYLVCAQR